MLAFISPRRPEIIDLDNEHFNSALTIKCDKTPIKSLKTEEAAAGEICFTTLKSHTSAALKLLHIDDCPKLSPQGISSKKNNFNEYKILIMIKYNEFNYLKIIYKLIF